MACVGACVRGVGLACMILCVGYMDDCAHGTHAMPLQAVVPTRTHAPTIVHHHAPCAPF
eukprot:m.236849 g.236849  ORF g.236849 m.236849 type:complete len:59 (+) comp47017_c0_seq1:37-213(+)